MVAFGRGWDWVPRSLQALRNNTAEEYEVILVDNGGTTEAPRVDDSAVELIRNTRNVGFGPGSNQGARRARGDVLVFLNTDVFVEPGWLPPLLERIADREVGAAFPVKLNLDRTIQEAGAFVTCEANSYLFGNGEAADQPAYAFPREVDFSAAAAMCLTKTQFESMTGFDPAYRLAYYEDADLCFRLRAQGLRLVYEPRSRVIHARQDAPPSPELAEAVAGNREVFRDRWGAALAGRPAYDRLAVDESARVAARDTHAFPRILVSGEAGDWIAETGKVASAYPRARVTLLAEEIEPSIASALLTSGVEVVQSRVKDEWLAERQGHYSHLVAGPARRRALLDSQPDAVEVGSLGELEALLARERLGGN